MRDAGNFGTQDVDFPAIFRELDRVGSKFTLFGGEALLSPIEDLSRVWQYGYEKHGVNGIQTNGALITDEHITLFKKYNVQVGMSMDGPEDLNDSRWAGSLEKTRLATDASHSNLHKLLGAGIIPSLIVTLYRGNAVGERLERLVNWFVELDRAGLRHARLHLLEVDHAQVAEHYALTDEENLVALTRLHAVEAFFVGLRFDIFADIEKLLSEDGTTDVTCIWNACDPYTTAAVQDLSADGTWSNCGRTNKEGINWRKGDIVSHERQLLLYHTPQNAGGCLGCRFFFSCKGECPGTAIDGDWRNRSSQCKVWMGVHEMVEDRLVSRGVLPLSLSPRRHDLDQAVLRRSFGGSADASHGDVPHGDAPHGDSHGDSAHGDHTDRS